MPDRAGEFVPNHAPGAPRDLALLSTDTNFIQDLAARPLIARSFETLDIYDLEHADLMPYLGLVVPGLTDQEYLWRHAAKIRSFLDAGRVVVFSGMLFRPWLPGAGMFVPKVIRSHHDYALRQVSPSPIFEGIEIEDLVFRRGVAGFFARGHHAPPPGAEVMLEFLSGEAALYVDRASTAGAIVVHGGNDLIGRGDDGTTADRLGPQLLAWMRSEAREHMRGLTGSGAAPGVLA